MCKCKATPTIPSTIIGMTCPRCSNLCPDGFRDCDDCLCKGCSRNRCRLGCPNGFMENERGCKMCACRQKVPKVCRAIPKCPFLCRYGRLKDNNGCETCSCKNNPENNMCDEDLQCPGLRCGDRHLKLNRDGCQICQCQKFKSNHKTGNRDQERMCSIPMCTARCAHGLASSRGCPSCDCKPPPSKPMCGILNACKIRCMRLKTNSYGCEICECDDSTTIMRDRMPDPCPRLQCPLACSGLYHIGPNGCKECRCIGDYNPDIRCQLPSCEMGECLPDTRHDERGCPICLCSNDRSPPSIKIEGADCDRKEENCGDLRCGDQGFAYDSRGCKICECAPPIRDSGRVCQEPECSQHCTGGYLYDHMGCMTCDCKIASNPTIRGNCDQQSCSEHCEFGREVDIRGCEICLCRYEPVCPTIDITCQLDCPNGLAHDQNECPVCACKCPRQTCRMGCRNGFAVDPVTMCELCKCAGESDDCPASFELPVQCASYCENGYAKDILGCETCVCKTLEHFRECILDEQYCSNPCIHGYVRDMQGCRTCKCIEVSSVESETYSCPETMCKLFCHAGFIKNSLGCNVCQCRKQACDQECSDGKLCSHGFVIDREGCSTCECKAAPCPELSCQLRCEFGLTKDDRDCDICRCKGKPITGDTSICTKPEPLCSNYCILYVTDAQGCLTCMCRSGYLEDEVPLDLLNSRRKNAKCETPQHQPECENFCEEYTYDEFNCLTCGCYQPVSLKVDGSIDRDQICQGIMPMCYNYCHEYLYNENNCMTCTCVSGNNEDIIPAKLINNRRKLKHCKGSELSCSNDCDEYKYGEDNCKTCTCFSEDFDTVEPSCSLLMCSNFCNEYIVDSKGCKTCGCISGLDDDSKPDDLVQTVCTKPEPMCSYYCKDYVYDEENCMTCYCKSGNSEDARPADVRIKPEIKCNKRGKDCFKYCTTYLRDSNNCEICACQMSTTMDVTTDEIICKKPQPMCHKYCDKYIYDEENCQTCICVSHHIDVPLDKVCPEVSCDKDCNLIKDDNNCDFCVCSDNSIPDLVVPPTTRKCVDPMCSNYCKIYDTDSKGCKTCICRRKILETPFLIKESKCPNYRTVCERECPAGYIRDANDCLTCDCQANNMVDRKLATVITTTAEPTTRKGVVCPQLRNCWKFCITGRMRDEDGCSLCQCNPISSKKKRHGW